jgi:hypothetical protein
MQSGPLVEGLHIGDETPVNWRERNYELYNVFPIAADGSKTVRQGTPPLAYGDRVCLSPHHIRLHIAGSWLIDFTAPAESTK